MHRGVVPSALGSSPGATPPQQMELQGSVSVFMLELTFFLSFQAAEAKINLLRRFFFVYYFLEEKNNR